MDKKEIRRLRAEINEQWIGVRVAIGANDVVLLQAEEKEVSELINKIMDDDEFFQAFEKELSNLRELHCELSDALYKNGIEVEEEFSENYYKGLTEAESKKFQNGEHRLLFLIIKGTIRSDKNTEQVGKEYKVNRNFIAATFRNDSGVDNNLFLQAEKVKLVVKYCKANDIQIVPPYDKILKEYGL